MTITKTLSVLLIVSCLAGKAAFAAGPGFLVNDPGDGADASPDGVCATLEGTCTLRAAIEEANASLGVKEIIRFEEGLGPVELADPLPRIVDSVAIVGDGPVLVTVDSNGLGPVFGISSGTHDQTLILQGLHVTGGVSETGGAVWVDEGDEAGIRNSHIEGNRAGAGGGVYVAAGASALIENTTFSANQALASGGGAGGAVINFGTLEVINGTFSGNGSEEGGGAIHNVVGATTEVVSCTFLNNDSPNATSIFNETGGTVSIRNSILADESPFTPYNCQGVIASSLDNISNDYACGAAGGFIHVVADVLIDPFLRDRGGAVPTHILLEGSPAIDAIDPEDCIDLVGNLLEVDQRGFARPGDGDGDGFAACDTGTVEIVCGDGIAQSFAGEECDEGNISTPRCGYGLKSCVVCAHDCTLQPGETQFCGDGVRQDEECDDGNNEAGDGCDADCRVETSGGGGTGGGTTSVGTGGGTSSDSVSETGGGCSLMK